MERIVEDAKFHGQGNGVTIGIPVFNEELRIERAIRSAAPQCARLLVADNASTDGTEAICHRLLGEFNNMEYFRHDHNMGALKNGRFILDRTETPFVMVMGSHDYIDDDFIERLLGVLSSDSSVVLAMGGLKLEDDGRSEEAVLFNDWKGGLQDNSADRVRAVLFDRANLPWAVYGLFRTEIFRRCVAGELPPYGIDVVFLAKIASHGKIAIVKETLFHAWIRDKSDNTTEYVERIIGRKEDPGKKKSMRNDMRIALHDVLASCEVPVSRWQKIMLRFQTMVRLGTFRRPGHDYQYYLLYLPVKIARKIRWLSCSANKK